MKAVLIFKRVCNKQLLLLFLIVIMGTVSKTFAQRGNPRVEYMGKSIDEMIYEFMEQKQIPGLTLAIVQAPYIPRVVGYGVSDASTEKGEALASALTIWPAGPISQGYAAIAVFQLYETGKIDINKPISTYLKDIPQLWKNITVYQLLQHASGIADYSKVQEFRADKKYTFNNLIQLVKDKPLNFTSGEKVQSSATNFLILTEIIEKVAKTSYHDFVWKHQINSLGLKQTFFKEDLASLPEDKISKGARHEKFKSDMKFINPSETTKGFVLDTKTAKLKKVSDKNIPLKGFSDIYASAQDISTWDIGLAGSVLVKKQENRDFIYKSSKLANSKEVPAMAGWEFYKHQGFMDIKGSTPGHSSYLSRFTDAKDLVCVTLMCNLENVDFTDLARRIAAAYDSSMGNGVNPEYVFSMESAFSVEETISNLKSMIEANKVPVFAQFDHKKNAENVDLNLADNQVIVFGNPAVGTHLMQENPSISQDLPLRINVWQDAQGRVWAGFNQTKHLEKKYNMSGNKILGNMQKLLEKLVYNATHVYKI